VHFANVFERVARDFSRGESAMRGALNAGSQPLGNAELLALQVGVYRYSELVELGAKLVDRVQSGVKAVLQAQ
jgi:hypothetical protein